MKILIEFLYFALLYFIGEGATEGFTWSNQYVRDNNNIIGKTGLFDYHTYRVGFENVGMVGMIIVAFLQCGELNIIEFLLLFSGSFLLGVFVYEKIFDYVAYGKFWAQKSDYVIFKSVKFIRGKYTWIYDMVFLISGIILLIIYVYIQIK